MFVRIAADWESYLKPAIETKQGKQLRPLDYPLANIAAYFVLTWTSDVMLYRKVFFAWFNPREMHPVRFPALFERVDGGFRTNSLAQRLIRSTHAGTLHSLKPQNEGPCRCGCWGSFPLCLIAALIRWR